MKKRLVFAVTALVMVLIATQGFAEYSRSSVVKVMRANVSYMQKANAAAGSEDYFEAAKQLTLLASGMIGIMDFDPRKGEKSDWDKTFEAFLEAAFEGIAASVAQDGEALKKAITELGKLNRQGHSSHK